MLFVAARLTKNLDLLEPDLEFPDLRCELVRGRFHRRPRSTFLRGLECHELVGWCEVEQIQFVYHPRCLLNRPSDW